MARLFVLVARGKDKANDIVIPAAIVSRQAGGQIGYLSKSRKLTMMFRLCNGWLR